MKCVVKVIFIGVLLYNKAIINCLLVSEDGKTLNFRLPTAIKPLHYELTLQPFFENSSFYGQVIIDMQCLNDTDIITLHSNNLTIRNESIKLLSLNNITQHVNYYDYDVRRHFLNIYLNKSLQSPNLYNLSMEFYGTLNVGAAGFYTIKYGNGSMMATTVFEPTDARRVFPCFDEPALKAKFSIKLVRSPEFSSISNMPQKITIVKDDNWIIDVYETTPTMSTYLLAFIVTDFPSISSKSQGGVDFRIFSRSEVINLTKFAADFAPKVLDFYDEYFGISYPLPKLDMIVLPDFPSSAMENWGLITYRESTFLYDEKISSVTSKENVAKVIVHELAHQWFGNLVSPEWWDYLWLNEGFATFTENFVVDRIYKEWKMGDRFAETLHSVLEDDSLRSSHPVLVPVQNPDEIIEIFDSISYNKGASIIKMMVHFLGESIFRDGLKSYFEDKKYANAVQDDLWKHMSKAAERINISIDVKRVMDTWTVQTGYPVVAVTKNKTDQSIILTQKAFYLIPDQNNANVSAKGWEIPITFTTQSEADFKTTTPVKWMRSSENSITLNWSDGVPLESDWLICNIQQTGYFRVNYEKDNWVLITNQLLSTDYKVIHVLNRAQLIDDSFNLARAGLLDYAIALNLASYLKREDELVPWQAAIRNFVYIDNMLGRTDAYDSWKRYMLELIEPQYRDYSFSDIHHNDVNHLKIILQKFFVRQACELELEDCTNKSASLYNEWQSDTKTLPQHLQDTIICNAIKKGGIQEWESISEKLTQSNVPSVIVSFVYALTCTEEPEIISTMLNIAMANNYLSSYESLLILKSIAKNKKGRYILFNFTRGHLEALKEKFPEPFLFTEFLQSALQNLNTPLELNQLKIFLNDHKGLLKSFDRTVKQIVEETEINVLWMKKNFEKIKEWLLITSD